MQRTKRTRTAVKALGLRPRLSVHRSNRFISVQLIDDSKMHTLAAASSTELEKGKRTKIETAMMVGENVGKKAKELGITEVVFDRGSYRYHGRVKAVAEGARKAGLQF
jgi:large subunit ribosomal protein L18